MTDPANKADQPENDPAEESPSTPAAAAKAARAYQQSPTPEEFPPASPPGSAEAGADAAGDGQQQAEVAQLKDQLLRALAETENTRRRAERDREDASKYAVANFARDVLTVSDNLRRAIDALPADAKAGNTALATLMEGVELTERQLQSMLEKHGITKVMPMDQPFDPNLHQAMFEVPGTGKPGGTVVQVLQAGFVIHGRLLRPALVGVAKG
ncbi:MAG: nucleotide exchange factor GrpE [Alphaproteobacteria bacterium]|nr:nucleotide exchange factor GrpE [Alphaproteobacteria bacterium]